MNKSESTKSVIKDARAVYSAVPKGYKQTEVGVIPEDWDIRTLGEIGESLIGLTYRPSDVHSNGILVLRSSNVQNGRICFDDNVFVMMDISPKLMVKNGDILICVRNGSRDLIGKCAQIDDRAKGMTFGAFMTVFRTELCQFTFHQFQSNIIKKQINEHLGATINQITNRNLNSFKIPIPPALAEQEAIAEALSDTDAYIESLEQLIQKKRLIKHGAMQELLTGKCRLPGFTEEWEVKRLGDNCDLITKGTTPTSLGCDFTQSGITFLKAESFGENGQVIPDKIAFIDIHTHKILNRSQLAENDLLISIAGVLGRVGIIDKNILPANINQALSLIRLSKDTDVDRYYLYWYLKSSLIQQQINDINVQAAQANISLQNVRDFTIHVPANLSEQSSIAYIISDMDDEISSLEEKLKKARLIKQGMMQELLTGRIRLV